MRVEPDGRGVRTTESNGRYKSQPLPDGEMKILVEDRKSAE